MSKMNSEHNMPSNEKVWISFCSRHQDRQADCSACNAGCYVTQAELDADRHLFTTDYAAWFRYHNEGKEPDATAWSIYEQITVDHLEPRASHL